MAGREDAMSSTVTSSARRRGLDHFEPEDVDPQVQRRLRGILEQIDYTAFASNKALIGQALGHVDASHFQHMAVAAAQARAQWVATAVAMTETAHTPSPEQIQKLAQMRSAYDELAEAYEALRRMVERGYVMFRAAPGSA
jgi:long-subunit acyl-CoA synthetase (AMP-forming)